jgi:ligand-binding sensor domain-containing protein
MIDFSKIILLFFFISVATHSFSQDINYTFHNYTLKDGLAGNNVYCATQDKEGFIWFGTETGLSRFDGSHFKNYTVADGLPDNEILNIFTDNRGRIWLVPFKKSVSYIYKRKIYNSTNDSILKKIKILGNCYNITEDNDHRIIIHDSKAIHIVDVNGQIKSINVESFGKNAQFVNVYRTSSGNIYVLTKRDVFKLERSSLVKIFSLPETELTPFFTTLQTVTDSSVILQSSGKYNPKYPMVGEYFFYSKIANRYSNSPLSGMFESVGNKFYTTSSIGVNFINIRNTPLKSSLIIDKPVNRLFLDWEGNTYLLSRNAGVFVKSNAEIMHKNFSNNDVKDLGVDYINGRNNTLFIGAANNNPILVDKNNLNKANFLSTIKSHGSEIFGGSLSPICYFNKSDNNRIIVANASGVFSGGKKEWERSIDKVAIKYVQEVDNNYLIGTVDKLVIASKTDVKILDTFWNERTTAANFIDNNYYIGTINGLYKLTINKTSTYLGDSIPIFQRRISSIKKGLDGIIWVGTYDAGVVAYKNGKVLQVFNDSNGLTSNICRNLFINANYLWVGTDKGLNKIDISKPPYKIVINYTTTDGLASNMINAVYTDSNMVYVGTPEGLTFFDETKIVNDSKCNMRILGITVSGKDQQWDSTNIILKHADNNIRFDFVGLSFKSAGDVMYSYRLVGLDNEWKTTRENYLDYPTLPSGNYTLEIQATNKFGIKSEIVKIDFEIEKLLLEKLWVRLLLLLLSLGLIYFYVNRRINKIKERAREKQVIANKLNEMEQMALRSQMNPHFIFNCLNSIQDYVINSDVQGANKFITDFSRLIRSTLDNSSKKTISIEDEIKYLTNYLTIEQYRFENKFAYNIYKDEQINLQDNHIPPMLLQPYVENAIRHGINNKKEGVGFIQINILKQNNNLVCEIIDNGVGRKAAFALKGNNAIEYQSKGMDLTAKRIQLLNKNVGEDIVIKIEDVEPPKMGTKVTVFIPMI